MLTLKTFTDSVNECDCCGRTELKGTFLVLDELKNEFYYGSSCAKNKLNVSDSIFKSEYLKIKTTEKIDALMIETKIEYKQVKIYLQAIKSGYDKASFFIKYGKISDFSNEFENVYEFAHLTFRILKI